MIKKMDGTKVKFILLKKVGEAYIDMTVDDDTMRRSLKKCSYRIINEVIFLYERKKTAA